MRFLLSSNDLLKEFGLGSVEHRVGGDITQIPAELRSFSSGKYRTMKRSAKPTFIIFGLLGGLLLLDLVAADR